MTEFATTRVSPAPRGGPNGSPRFLRRVRLDVRRPRCDGPCGVCDRRLACRDAGDRVEPPAFLGALFVELAVVFYLSARVQSLTSNAATLCLFPALLGSERRHAVVLLLAYPGASIATTFVVTAGMFGALAASARRDKQSGRRGQFFVMGLVGWCSLDPRLFWHNDALQS